MCAGLSSHTPLVVGEAQGEPLKRMCAHSTGRAGAEWLGSASQIPLVVGFPQGVPAGSTKRHATNWSWSFEDAPREDGARRLLAAGGTVERERLPVGGTEGGACAGAAVGGGAGPPERVPGIAKLRIWASEAH